MTLELAWDVPCSKQSRGITYDGESATIYSAWAHDGANEQMYPRDDTRYFGEDEVKVIVIGETVSLYKTDSGVWYFERYASTLLGTWDRFWRDAPQDWIQFFSSNNILYEWYHAGDGVYGGAGNPPLIQLDPTIEQLYI